MNVRTLCPTGLPRSNRRTFIRTATALSAATLAPRRSLAEEDTDGKTNTPEFTMSYDTRNFVFGFIGEIGHTPLGSPHRLVLGITAFHKLGGWPHSQGLATILN